MNPLLFLVVQILVQYSYALVNCDQSNATKMQLCSVSQFGEKNEFHDLYGYPDAKSGGEPMNLHTALTLISIAEFNAEQNTILLNIILSLFWNDTRISLIQDK